MATDHSVRRQPGDALGVTYKILSLKPKKYFGIMKEWIDEIPFGVINPEKTIIDGLDLPQHIGGISEIAKALTDSWTMLDEKKLRKYATKIGNSAIARRPRFIMDQIKKTTSFSKILSPSYY